MKRSPFVLLAILLTAALTSCVAVPLEPVAGVPPQPTDIIALPQDGMPAAASGLPANKPDDDVLSPELAAMLAAYRAGDDQPAILMAQVGGDPETGRLRVILEMAVDPEARAGPARTEVITLADGSQTTIEHAPQIKVRSDLAGAISTAGATVETAYENLVQVLTPVEGLERLSRIPGVSRIRLPYPAEPQGPSH